MTSESDEHDDRGGRDTTARWISSGTVFGVVAGLAIGAIAGGFAYLFIDDAIERLQSDEPGVGAWVAALGLLMVAASVNCVFSGFASYRAARAGRHEPFDGEMAGEASVTKALGAGKLWAYLVFVAFGLALLGAAAAVFVVGEDVGTADVGYAAFVACIGLGLIWFARHSRRNPGWLEED